MTHMAFSEKKCLVNKIDIKYQNWWPSNLYFILYMNEQKLRKPWIILTEVKVNGVSINMICRRYYAFPGASS